MREVARCQQEVRDVGRGDQQQESHGPEQELKPRADVPNRERRQGHHLGTHPSLGGWACERVERVLGLGLAHAVKKPRERVDHVLGGNLELVRIEQVHGVEVEYLRVPEVTREHAHNRIGSSIQGDSPAENVRIASPVGCP